MALRQVRSQASVFGTLRSCVKSQLCRNHNGTAKTTVIDATVGLDSEQCQVYERTLHYARTVLAPHVLTWDKDGTFPREALQRGAGLGLGALYCATQYGGSDFSVMTGSVMMEALAQASPSIADYVSKHSISAWIIQTSGTDEQKEEWIPELASMNKLASICLAEAGNPKSFLSTSVREIGDQQILNGAKCHVLGGGHSDVYLVMANNGGVGPVGISCVAVDKGTPGLSFGPTPSVFWFTPTIKDIHLKHVQVPGTQCIGTRCTGGKIASLALSGERLNQAAVTVGAAHNAVQACHEYLRARKAANSRDIQSLNMTMVEMASRLISARLMTRHAAQALDSDHQDSAVLCAMAKCSALHMSIQVHDQAIRMQENFGIVGNSLCRLQRNYMYLRTDMDSLDTNAKTEMMIAKNLGFRTPNVHTEDIAGGGISHGASEGCVL